jgi:hypothetical protein
MVCAAEALSAPVAISELCCYALGCLRGLHGLVFNTVQSHDAQIANNHIYPYTSTRITPSGVGRDRLLAIVYQGDLAHLQRVRIIFKAAPVVARRRGGNGDTEHQR